jgi:hypothetical protein
MKNCVISILEGRSRRITTPSSLKALLQVCSVWCFNRLLLSWRRMVKCHPFFKCCCTESWPHIAKLCLIWWGFPHLNGRKCCVTWFLVHWYAYWLTNRVCVAEFGCCRFTVTHWIQCRQRSAYDQSVTRHFSGVSCIIQHFDTVCLFADWLRTERVWSFYRSSTAHPDWLWDSPSALSGGYLLLLWYKAAGAWS